MIGRTATTMRLVAATLLGAATLAAPPLAAQQRSLTIEDFDALIEVRPDGTMSVTETLRVRFVGEWNGVQRNLSLQHRTADGRRARLNVTVGPATDDAGRPLRMESSREAGTRRLRIWVPDARNATRTVVLRYDVANALRFFPEDHPTGFHDELYWNVTGNDWEVPILAAAAHVVLPPGVDGVQAWAYTGPEGGNQQDATIDVQGRDVRVRANRPVSPGEGLTVAVSWPPGVVQRPSAVQTATADLRYLWPLLLPLLALWVMARRWWRHGRDPESRAIAVQYEPPPDLSPAEIGTLVDHRAETHDIVATLVDLAVRGFLSIEEQTEKRLLGLITAREYEFHLRRPRSEWKDLLPHERLFLAGLFEKAKVPASADAPPTVALSDLTNEFYKKLGPIRDAIYDRLVEHALYTRRPDKVKTVYLGVGFAIVALGIAAGIAVSEGAPEIAGPLALFLGLASSGVIIIGFGLAMPARTIAGARIRDAALGFKEFLERVESPRYRMMITGPELFERYLPHAMAFRVEDRWASAFDDLLRVPPDWYHGGSFDGGFHASTFTRSLSTMSQQAGQSLSSSPSSSGSGGGGSSGGGSGGGGGGGF